MGNILNLVFDNWTDGNTPIPNGYSGSITSENYIINSNELFEIKKVGIDAVNNSENFFYPITIGGSVFEYLTNNNSLTIDDYFGNIHLYFFPNRVVKDIKHKGLKVIFLNGHEIDFNITYSIRILDEYIKENGLNPKNFYIINNDVNIDLYQPTTNINLKNIKYLPEMIAKKLSSIDVEFNTDKKGKFILLHNRKPKSHRIVLLALLKKYNLLDDVNWSLLDGWNKTKIDIQYNSILSSTLLKELSNELNYFESIDTKHSDYELDLNLKDKHGDTAHATNVFTKEEGENSYIYIVSETEFIYNSFTHITEKSFKPFYFYQIPIFVAKFNYVKQFKELYDFDLYEDLVDHSYDNEENAQKRMIMIVNEIRRLINNQDKVKTYYENNKERFLKNKKIVDNIPNLNNVNKLFFDLINEKNEKTSLI